MNWKRDLAASHEGNTNQLKICILPVLVANIGQTKQFNMEYQEIISY